MLVSDFSVENVIQEMTMPCPKDEERRFQGFGILRSKSGQRGVTYFNIPSDSQTNRGVCFIYLHAQWCAVGACAGKDVCQGARWGAAVCAMRASSGANRRSLHASFLHLLFVLALLRPRGSWERDTVVVGRNQLQKQSLYLA